MVKIEKEKILFTRRALFFSAAGFAVNEIFPKRIFAQEETVPSWIMEKYVHLKLEKTGPELQEVSESFNIDPHVLLAILIMESPDEISTSYAGAQGPFQIMPGTRRELMKTINNSDRLQRKFEALNLNYFEREVFLACVYLEDERVNVPKGRIIPFEDGYFTKLHQLKIAAIKYHDGPNSDPTMPTGYGKIAGERVSEIFQLLKKTKGVNEINPEVAVFLNL